MLIAFVIKKIITTTSQEVSIFHQLNCDAMYTCPFLSSKNQKMLRWALHEAIHMGHVHVKSPKIQNILDYSIKK